MAKLYFRYSTMNAGKSIDLIRTNYNYVENGKKTLCFTSAIDNRYEVGKITSRIGLSIDAIPVDENTNIFDIVKENNFNADLSCIFVDEVQFLNKKHIFQLSDVVDDLNIPVICYGLRSDFMMNSFEGSENLMSIADNIEEIKTICSCCKSKKAIINTKFSDGKIVSIGEQIQIGGNDTYKPLCRKCYKKLKNN
jgi:thymidine kinase